MYNFKRGKQRNTKDRIRDRTEFVHKYRRELIAIGHDLHKAKVFVETVAREELEYSPHTYYFDIWMSLRRTALKIKNS